MWQKVANWNTLRNQMLAGFIAVMIIVLICAGAITYNSVSTLLNTKAETQMKQIASQANGRLEAIITQIDTLTLQAVNDVYLQQLFLSSVQGKAPDFSERQSLLKIANHIQAYSGVSNVELYTTGFARMFPLDEQKLTDLIEPHWIEQADKEKGKLIWIGSDPKYPETVLAIRRINLVDRWFSNGGYLMVRMNRSYFDFQNQLPDTGHRELMLLADSSARPIVSEGEALGGISSLMHTDAQQVTLEQRRYILVKQLSEQTGWTMMILYPVSDITDGISVLRWAIIVSGAIGLVLFIILSFLLSSMITRPILRLMRAMRNTRQGVLTPNLTPSYTTELNDLNVTYNQMVDNINRLIKLVYEKEMIQSRTELQALQAQIDPHFLYNTLEALYWSLQEKDEEELADLVVAMSDLFRYVIGNPNKDVWVTLDEELEHIKRYLSIMSVRFGSRLVWNIDSEDVYGPVHIPKLLIQPLVENAILHGLEGKIGTGLITIRVEPSPIETTGLRITVCDDGPGMNEQTLQAVQESIERGGAAMRVGSSSSSVPSPKGKGMAISNVQRRLQLYYPSLPDTYRGLTITSSPGLGTSVSFDIPIFKEEHDEPIGENHSHR
ncbi:sensor histidine kinase [Paenibacillus qinlingensis]|uniref:Two-component system sensor histidine kinase YesM n=1 Tax=Paenibacillus qinlingensis TaxID=1837343 RepID=A0ABU1P1D4_9BACL|nr:sensor histidine kinase [Paenibacillus qinlingensis]MDR6553339.1 two-component system sensor histidine kinase YesM [Paenibacillus qinlingensis]